MSTTQEHDSERKVEEAERRRPEVVMAPEREVMPGLTGDRLLGVQEGSGNAAVGRLASGGGRDGPPVQQRTLQRYDKTSRADMLSDELSRMNQSQKIDKLRELVKGGSASDLMMVWRSVDDAYAVAKANPDVFKASMEKCGTQLAELSAFKGIQEKFKGDVEALALSYLDQNRDVVAKEMDKIAAHDNEEADANPTVDQQHELHELQLWAKVLADCQKALAGFTQVPVGYESDVVDGPGHRTNTIWSVAFFNPDQPPMYTKRPEKARIDGEEAATAAKIKPWEDIKKSWDDVTTVKQVCEQKSPALAMMSEKKDPKATQDTADADLVKARKDIGKGLKELTDRIEKAVPLVGSKIDYEDLVPIHTSLFSGAKGASGQNWADPIEQSVAKAYVKDADASRLLASLGLGALSAAAFILAPFTGGATLVALLAVGVGASATNAAMSWNRWDKLSTAAAATGVSPKFSIISKEQADSALITAIIDTAFAIIDVVGAAKAFKAGLAARELLKAAEAGAKEAAEQALKDLSKGAAASAAAVEKAIAELGPQEASRISGKSFKDLAEIVGHDTEAGSKLLALDKLGPEGAAKAASDAVEAMKNLKNLDKVAANEAVLHSLDNLGYVGTIKQGGGWKEITKLVGEQSAAAGKMEGWRKSILAELQKFLEAEEKEAASKAVRTGTEKATSDMDVQAVGGAAALNAEKSEMWLAKRLGIDRKELKNVLDATIFVDPTRAHLYDVIKELSEADRAAIGASQAGLEKRLIYGARLAEAQAHGDAKLAKEIIEEAGKNGVSDLKVFKPFTDAEQKALAQEIDGMIKELKTTEDAGRKAALTKQIGEKQAMINASHPEAYLGGGVRIQVTERPGDKEKMEAALGGKLAGPATSAQRLIAVLSEGKFFDEAIAAMRKPAADTLEVAGALKDLGKHAERACEVAGRGGVASPELIEIGARMELLSKAAKRPDFIKSLGDAAQMDKLVEHATGLLENAKSEVAKAVEELSKTAKIAEISAQDLDKLRFWTSFNLKYAAAAQAVNQTLPASLEAFHQIVREAEQRAAKDGDKKPAPDPGSPDGGGGSSKQPAPPQGDGAAPGTPRTPMPAPPAGGSSQQPGGAGSPTPDGGSPAPATPDGGSSAPGGGGTPEPQPAGAPAQ